MDNNVNYTLHPTIEYQYIPFSIAKYRTCWVKVNMTAKWIKEFSQHKRYEEIDKCLQECKQLAKETLNVEQVETMTAMSGQPLEMLYSFRNKEWEQEAIQSLVNQGMTQEDILNGKDLMITDHTGLIMPKEDSH